MNTEYYETETVEMVVRLRVQYKRGAKGAREHIIAKLPGLVSHVDSGGCHVRHGCYGAKFVDAAVTEREPA